MPINKSIVTNSADTIYDAEYYSSRIHTLKRSRILMIVRFWLFDAWKLPRRVWGKDEDGKDILVLNKYWLAYYNRLDSYQDNILHLENHWTYRYWIERP